MSGSSWDALRQIGCSFLKGFYVGHRPYIRKCSRDPYISRISMYGIQMTFLPPKMESTIRDKQRFHGARQPSLTCCISTILTYRRKLKDGRGFGWIAMESCVCQGQLSPNAMVVLFPGVEHLTYSHRRIWHVSACELLCAAELVHRTQWFCQYTTLDTHCCLQCGPSPERELVEVKAWARCTHWCVPICVSTIQKSISVWSEASVRSVHRASHYHEGLVGLSASSDLVQCVRHEIWGQPSNVLFFKRAQTSTNHAQNKLPPENPSQFALLLLLTLITDISHILHYKLLEI